MKKRQLLIIAAVTAIIGLISLGLTRKYVVDAAALIISKDKQGSATQTDIAALANYVHGHTRASVTFGLDGSYRRAVQAAELAAVPQANGQVYAAAQAACTVKNPVTTATCIQQYVQTHAAPGTQPRPPVLPDYNSYVYHLTSPDWAPDITGLSFLAGLVCLSLIAWSWLFARAKRPSY